MLLPAMAEIATPPLSYKYHQHENCQEERQDPVFPGEPYHQPGNAA